MSEANDTPNRDPQQQRTNPQQQNPGQQNQQQDGRPAPGEPLPERGGMNWEGETNNRDAGQDDQER